MRSIAVASRQVQVQARRFASCFLVNALIPGILSFALASVAKAQDRPPGPDAVFIPHFWELGQRLEKPDLAGLRVIRFLTEDDYPPMHFQTEDGRLAGFNVDLARAICETLNVSCTVQARRWDTLMDSLREGRGDAVIASVKPSAALRTEFAFSTPYLRTPGRFVARTPGLEPTPGSLAGRSVAVVFNSAHEAYLRDFFPRATLKGFDDLDRARSALARGEVDLLFGDGLTLALWLNGSDSAGCCTFVGGPYTESRYFGEGVAIAMRRNEPVLRRGIDYALRRLAAQGVYAELYLRYFPVGFY